MAQTIRNFGDLEVHDDGHLGFYSKVQNDGLLLGVSGLVGFYGNSRYSFSGSFIPSVHDLEIANEEGIFLEIPLIVNNNMNYIYGNITTDRSNPNNFLELTADASYQGQSDFSKIDGFAKSTVTGDYILPVGDEFYLRPLAVKTAPENSVFKGAYFFDNPQNLHYYTDTSSGNGIQSIGNNEFWKLTGNASVPVTLSWNQRSALFALASDTQYLTVVGYHKETEEWLDLGAIEITGSLNEGFITSNNFVPNDYEVLTFGSVLRTAPLSHKGYHYIVTPNNDGINDFLYIPELENYRNNTMLIFDRNGLKVFEAKNYINEFSGTCPSTIPCINRDIGLPEGIYFYKVHLNDNQLTLQGFLYLER